MEVTDPHISFHEESRSFPSFFDEGRYLIWLQKVADSHDVTIQSLSYILCSDDHLLEINREHLDHDYYTDIITFPYQEGEIVSGDMFISVDRILDNAKTLNVTDEEEFKRVIVHGLLHLIGFDDKTEDKQKQMRKVEDEALALYA